MGDAGAGCGMDDESVAGEGAVRSRKALYDAACKRVLSNKIILAWILKSLLAEFESCPVETIADSCIEGDPLVGGAGESGDIGASHNLGVGTAPLIAGMGQGAPLASGDVLFDILFRAKAPGDGDWRGPVDLIINVESQHDFHPGYPLASRACYYCARLLASQHGVEFANSRYGDLKKVYSVWLCTDPPKFRRGTANWYDLREHVFPPGATGLPRGDYDLLGMAMLYLGGEDTGERAGLKGLLNLLTTVFVSDASPQEKMRVLEEGYNIRGTAGLESEVRAMGSFADVVERRGFEKGKAKGIEEGIEKGIERGVAQGVVEGVVSSLRSLLASTGWPLGRAMDALGIPEGERPTYRDLLAR